jgi:hypothetical protein
MPGRAARFACLLFFCASIAIPGISPAAPPALNTVNAGEKISAELAKVGNDPKNAARESQADNCGKYIEGLRTIYERAGYDFDKTVRRLPDFLKISGNVDISDKEMTGYMLTSILVAGIQNECRGGIRSYEKHFDAETFEAVTRIMSGLQ